MQCTLPKTGLRASSRPLAFAGHVAPSRPVTFVSTRRPTVQKLAIQCQAAAAEAAAPAEQAGKPTLHNQTAPETYAVVEVGGKQMFVEPGKWYTCNRLQVDVGDKIRLGRVLALKQGDSFTVGKPYLEDVAVEAEVLEELRGPKLIVYKMKPKKHYRRKTGHRQELTKFMVTKIGA
ncbi:plastid/chloroplast ribosomal protein L21 [Scenedesmus sp. NREL 46B-D3]|nr:plastid/chloroplast ribosomal protein L21 [Scenedesmus sp. NREL 46B-D3]